MKQLIATGLFLVFLVYNAYSQTTRSDETLKRIETYLSELDKAGLNASVLVELNGEKVISRGYGFSDISKNKRNTPNTIFDIGSLTKQYTATAILKLEMQG